MKAIILLILTLSFAGKQSLQQSNMKIVSINSKQLDVVFDIKITNINYHKIQNCEIIEFLNLSGMHLRFISNDIIRSNSIRHISLHNNLLKKIPQTVLNYVINLSCLNFSRNNINLYKDNQILHNNLRVLDLSYQQMSEVNNIELETSEEETDNIYTYMIFNNDKMRLPNVEYLDLSGNDISTILWNFNVSFPKLIRLDLININAVNLDPSFFNRIPTSLNVLHLENNHLRNVTLRNITEINALYLDRNPLKTLSIISTKLRILSLSNCTNLIEVFLDTPHLEEFDLSGSNWIQSIDSVPYAMFQSLRLLSLDYNKFISIPVMINNMQRLIELSIRYNIIKDIKPQSFQALRSLKKLSLKGNKIDRLEKESFSGLENLEYLDLSQNQLNYLASEWTIPLIKLQYLNVNSNQFTSISKIGIYSLTSLQYLFVINNTFTKITTVEMEHLPDFTTVYLV